jgi:NAD(P)-dependent dehydrogenase (short-subunit alcohol dehydrogenase family)
VSGVAVRYVDVYPIRRAGTAWEVAYATVFLLSDEAAYTTGHTLFVDGGFMLNGVHG